MKTWLSPIRSTLERVPILAESYRLIRDHVRFRTAIPRETTLGFKLAGGNYKIHQGRFEIEETKLIADRLADVDVFVDVGANVGFYTCLARSRGRRVIAIEPGSTVLRFLYANLLANGMTDVEVIPVGVSDHVEITRLYGGSGTASLIKGWSRASDVYSTVIPTTTLDRVLAGRFLNERLLIKMDIEGVEYPALRGAEETLARKIAPTWFLEIYLDVRHEGGVNPHFLDTFELFWRHGYEAREAIPDGRRLEQREIERWIASGRPQSSTPNFLFSKR